MLTISFQGWIQVRLATDPDPFDEPRGISGYVRTLPGEPDFDRIIRLHHPVAPRPHTPPTGVFVSTVAVNGQPQAGHVWIGAPVEWLHGPKFEGRNGIIAEDVLEPVLPFVMRVTAAGWHLERGVGAQHQHPFKELWGEGAGYSPDELSAILGATPAAFLQQRVVALQSDLTAVPDAIAAEGIRRRLAFLSRPDTGDFFRWGMRWRYSLESTASVSVPAAPLTPVPDASTPWITTFQIGAWDPDALGAYLRGMIVIPLVGAN